MCKQVQNYVLNGQLCDGCQIKLEQAEIMADQAKAATRAKRVLNLAKTQQQYVILDTETTSLQGWLIEVAVIDLTGTVLYNQRVKPGGPVTPEAFAVHGISDEMLADCPTFDKIYPVLAEVLRDKKVLAYNAQFDNYILDGECRHYELSELPVAKWYCVMELYAQYCGNWSDYYQSYRCHALPWGDHSAVGDCRGVLKLLHYMADNAPQPPSDWEYLE